MKGFYVGLWYGPTISEVSEFQVGVLGETKRVLPSIGGSGLFGSNKFDWHVERDPIISFKKSNLHGLRGGLGYSAYGVRIEAEFDHERGTLSSSGRGGGGVFIAKDRINQLASGSS